jgi:hypothetical protein
MFETQLESLKYATLSSFGWASSLLEWITTLFYGTVFGVSAVLLLLISIIIFLILNFTIADINTVEKTTLFGGRRKKHK